MGYILKKSGSAGAGDATAANQVKQIDQLEAGSATSSVFKDTNDASVFIDGGSLNSVFKDLNDTSVFVIPSGEGVFLDKANESVFFDNATNSVFKTVQNPISILLISKCTNGATTFCQSFQNTTPATLATDIQTWLQANSVAIIQIVYADAGGVAPNPHTALIIYNTY